MIANLRRRERKDGFAWYWIPPAKDIANGFRPKSIVLTEHSADEREQRCIQLNADLAAWRATQAQPVATNYSLSWLISRYQTDAFSPYRNLRARTARGYDHFCKHIAATVGERIIGSKADVTPRISGEDVRRWHMKWGENGRASRARHMLVMLRTLSAYAVEIGVPQARAFRDMLSDMRFPTVESRNEAPTRAQVHAIVSKALELGYRSIAITTWAQFELIERRTHIIGYYENGQWRPGWTWGNINKDWTITYFQTKSGRVERTFDLTTVPALLGLLQATPEAVRVGPVILAERTKNKAVRRPWTERHYATVFRKIARAAGVPDNVWSMDMRAGGATEADAIGGVSDRELQDAGGWKDPRTRDRYRRQKVRNAQNVVDLRQKAKDVDQK